MKQERGVSLVELATVMGIIGILVAIAIPSGLQMQQNARFRQDASAIGVMLREARARTVSLNREHRVEFDLTAGANQYRLAQGNLSSGSAVWNPVNPVGGGWVGVAQGVVLTQAGCPGAAPIYSIDFNPNGSAGTGCTIAVRNAGLTLMHQVTVTQNTGRVRIQ
jgi:prepilin-type N-terminal cleavage/methylation domain-containing protein